MANQDPSQPPVPDYYSQMQEELELQRNQNQQLNNALQSSEQNLYSNEETQNLVRWQLDLKEDLDKIYHLLRGDVVGYNEQGEMCYLPQKNVDLQPFSAYGVQLIMNILSFYLNRNTILSNYDLPTIQWKVNDFGIRLTDLIFNKYEDMMCTLEEKDMKDATRLKDHLSEKIKLYDIIVGELVDTVHSAYLRAYNGGERESLRTARHVTQSEPLTKMGMPQMMGMSKKKGSMFNPFSWGN